MKQECDYARTKSLDRSYQEILLEIKHSNEAIRELNNSVECLQKSSKDTVPCNIRGKSLFLGRRMCCILPSLKELFYL